VTSECCWQRGVVSPVEAAPQCCWQRGVVSPVKAVTPQCCWQRGVVSPIDAEVSSWAIDMQKYQTLCDGNKRSHVVYMMIKDFYCYFKSNAYHIHRGTLPPRRDFVRLLREDMPDNVKKIIFGIYLDATHKKQIKREYNIEYALWGSREDQRENRRLRSKNRKQLTQTGLVRKGDGKQIHHKDGNVRNNNHNNLDVISACDHNKRHGKTCKKTKRK
jgi:hypothetical protein